jgi:hypothetical protein
LTRLQLRSNLSSRSMLILFDHQYACTVAI